MPEQASHHEAACEEIEDDLPSLRTEGVGEPGAQRHRGEREQQLGAPPDPEMRVRDVTAYAKIP